MKTNAARLIGSVVVLLLGLSIRVNAAYAAASLQFSPATKTVTNNQTFTIDVTINTDGQNAMGANATVIYTPADLSVVSIENGSFFPDFTAPFDNGLIEIRGYFSAANGGKSGTGSLAKITFKATKASGTSDVGFRCTANSTSTQILNTDYTNILSCGNLNTSRVSFGGSNVDPTNTLVPTKPGTTTVPTAPTAPTATSTPGGSPTNKKPDCVGISALPAVSGKTNSEITFSCAGKDNDGSIYHAEFFFGDGTSKKISQIVGSSGTIMAKHTYTKTGTYTTACRVIDNDNATSDIPSICTLSYPIAQGSVQTTTKTTSTKNTTQLAVAPTLAPTIPVVTLEPYQSPTPLPVDLGATDFETQKTEEQPTSSMPWQWIAVLGGIGLLILIIFILIIKSFTRRRMPPQIPLNTQTDPSQPPQQYPQILEIDQQTPPQPPGQPPIT